MQQPIFTETLAVASKCAQFHHLFNSYERPFVSSSSTNTPASRASSHFTFSSSNTSPTISVVVAFYSSKHLSQYASVFCLECQGEEQISQMHLQTSTTTTEKSSWHQFAYLCSIRSSSVASKRSVVELLLLANPTG